MVVENGKRGNIYLHLKESEELVLVFENKYKRHSLGPFSLKKDICLLHVEKQSMDYSDTFFSQGILENGDSLQGTVPHPNTPQSPFLGKHPVKLNRKGKVKKCKQYHRTWTFGK